MVRKVDALECAPRQCDAIVWLHPLSEAVEGTSGIQAKKQWAIKLICIIQCTV